MCREPFRLFFVEQEASRLLYTVHHRLQQLLPREATDDDEESDGEHTDDEERLYRAMREEGQFVR